MSAATSCQGSLRADGSGLRNAKRNPASASAPAWSPDGRKIAFGRDGEIYVMNADGSGQRNLTRSPLEPRLGFLVARAEK